MAQGLAPAPGIGASTIAILPWGNAIEDFLDPIGLTLDAFCTRMTGGWLFGYAEALRLAGWRPTIVCVARGVAAPTRLFHAPTGTPMWVLPSPAPYRRIAARMRNPYAWSVEDAFGPLRGLHRRRARALMEIAPYLATPIRALSRALRAEGCTAMLVQEYEYPRFDVAVLLGGLLGIPVYATFQGGDRHAGALEDVVRPHALRRARGLAIATRAEAVRVGERYAVPSSRITRVQNPVDLDLWRAVGRDEARAALDLPAAARVAIWHGRVEFARKGLDVVLDAWARVAAARAGRDVRLLLIGSGADDAALRARLAEPALASVRWIAGYELDRTAMRRNLSAADVAVAASRLEGLPVAPLEAMACSLPLAASDIPPFADILERGLDSGGTTVPVGDADALAGALGRFLDDPALAREIGRNARRTIEERFSLAAVAAQLGRMLGGP